MEDFVYQTGFGNQFSTEALQGALPKGQNAPQKPPLGLVVEQISGTAFTIPRAHNLRSWCYRILPSVSQGHYEKAKDPLLQPFPVLQTPLPPTPLRWDPMPLPKNGAQDFIQGWFPLLKNGSPTLNTGGAVYLYHCNQSMENRYFTNADGELLIIPVEGSLQIDSEMGRLSLWPGQVCVIPRGIKCQVHCLTQSASGYLYENYGAPFRLPELGPLGANGLANPRDFEYPIAWFEEDENPAILVTKFQDHFWTLPLTHSPFNVVAWHGNYAPYRYELKNFCVINSVSFDHPDPSIFTVLTSPSEMPGRANCDFVIFPPRWLVAEHTFRPPYFHRNRMNECMGLIEGQYDAKRNGFSPGGVSVHHCMTPHGPETAVFEQATNATLKPHYLKNSLAFMLESDKIWQVTKTGYGASFRQKNYGDCWGNFPKHFSSAS